MRPEYDFSGGVRAVTAARYREGSNVVVIDPAVLDVFPGRADQPKPKISRRHTKVAHVLGHQ